MPNRSILGESVRRIRASWMLKLFAAVTAADYVGTILVAVLGRIDWQFAALLFLFSAATWYFTVSWAPFWSEIMGGRRGEVGMKFAEFVETFSLLALVLVHGLYSAILVVTVVKF